MTIDFDTLVLSACHGVFGERATWTPANGSAQTIIGVFNDRFQEIKYTDGNESIAYRPVISTRASQVTGNFVQGDTIAVRGITYLIDSIENDGVGDVLLYLIAANDAQFAITPTAPIQP
jgi:hypothetical protein